MFPSSLYLSGNGNLTGYYPVILVMWCFYRQMYGFSGITVIYETFITALFLKDMHTKKTGEITPVVLVYVNL